MTKHFFYLLFIAIAAGLFSCKTDIDLIVPRQETTIIYGLLNSQDSIHYIKINKSFVGEANAFDMAKVRDSAEYTNLSATIQRYENGVPQPEKYSLRDTTLFNKSQGIFHNPDHKLYYFIEPILDKNSLYKLTIDINNGQKTVSATTELIGSFSLNGGIAFSNPNTPLSFGNKNDGYNESLKYAINTVKNGKTYQLFMKFNYSEYYTDGSSDLSKSYTYTYPLIKSATTAGSGTLLQEISGEALFSALGTTIPALTDKIKYRTYRDIEFYVVVAGEELNTYLEVNQPSTGLIQEKPEYTNVDNGIGIFSTRTTVYSPIRKRLKDKSEDELYYGQYTSHLGFKP